MNPDFLALAVKEAEKGIRRGDGGPFGGVIVRRGKVVAVGHNTVLEKNDPTCHAEMNAIRIASKILKSSFLIDCEIYSTTEPCPMCFAAIHWAQIKKIIYSTTIGDVKKLGFNELTVSNQKMKRWGKSPVKLVRVKHAGCSLLLKKWEKMPQKKTY